MVVLRIVVLCGCGLMLGGCLSNGGTASIGPVSAPMAVSNADLPPATEPGRILKPGLGSTRGGVNPSAELTSSERARVAWTPIRPDRLNQAPTLSAHSASLIGPGDVADPTGTASVTPSSRVGAQRGPAAAQMDREAAMDRLEREAQGNSKSVCRGC